jgi:hypothetical protein
MDSQFYLGLFIGLTLIAAALAVFILFFLAQQNTLKAIQPLNRDMPPANVWLQLIPLFNLYYQFVVVNRISNSIAREMESRSADSGILPEIVASSGPESLRKSGLAYCILSLFGWIPIIGSVASVIALVFMIVYWVKLVEFKKKIEGSMGAIA